MKIGAIVQARMGSTRLPGKVLKEIDSRPMLSYLIERIEHSNELDTIVVATSARYENDAIERTCDELDVNCFRGKEEHLLDRYHQAAQAFDIDLIVRITADCPLVDFRVLDDMIASYRAQPVDYLTNNLPRTFPHGLDLSVIPSKVIQRVREKPRDRVGKHVTEYIRSHSSLHDNAEYSARNYAYDIDFSHVRITVDYPEDLEVIRFLAEQCAPSDHWLAYVAQLTRHPEYVKRNREYVEESGLL